MFRIVHQSLLVTSLYAKQVNSYRLPFVFSHMHICCILHTYVYKMYVISLCIYSLYTSSHTYTHVHIHVYIYICICIYIYVFIFIYILLTHTPTHQFGAFEAWESSGCWGWKCRVRASGCRPLVEASIDGIGFRV